MSAASLRIALAVSILVLGLGSNPAGAVPITTTVSGVVASTGGDLPNTFVIGEQVDITYTWETSTPASPGSPAGQGLYAGGLVSLTASFLTSGVSFTFGGGPNDLAIVLNDSPSGVGAGDGLTFSTITRIGGSLLGGALPINMSVSFTDAEVLPALPQMVTGIDVPTSPFPFDIGAVGVGAFDGQQAVTASAAFRFVPIPEPSSAALVAAGLGLLASRRRLPTRAESTG